MSTTTNVIPLPDYYFNIYAESDTPDLVRLPFEEFAEIFGDKSPHDLLTDHRLGQRTAIRWHKGLRYELAFIDLH